MYIWRIFIELHGGRQYGMEGALALTFTEIKSWCELMGVTLKPLEVKIIKRLDAVAVKNRTKK